MILGILNTVTSSCDCQLVAPPTLMPAFPAPFKDALFSRQHFVSPCWCLARLLYSSKQRQNLFAKLGRSNFTVKVVKVVKRAALHCHLNLDCCLSPALSYS